MSSSPPPLPSSTATYADVAYWDARFSHEAEFEWCGRYEDFRGAAAPHLRAARRVLVLGNGSSSLPLSLAADPGLPALSSIVVTDASGVAVAKGRARAAADAAAVAADAAARGRAEPPADLTWALADAGALPFADASFDAVIEKGVFDALAARHAGADPWAPPPALVADVGGAAAEARRVLAPAGGVLVSLSFAQPHFRTPLLASRARWAGVDAAPFGDDAGAIRYFMYVCRRGGEEEDGAGAGAGAGASRDPAAALVHWTPAVGFTHDHMEGEDFLMRCGLSEDEDECERERGGA